jgi:quinol monooxygenase YgiN
MTVTALLELRLTPETRQEGLQRLNTILVDTRAFPGCAGLEVLIDDADPAHVMIVERWESMEHDRKYREWRAGDGANDLGEYLAGPPSLTQYVAVEG